MTERDRGQMVLLAAVAIGVALVPMLLAYLQLGYHPDVAEPRPDHARDVERTLERELVGATADVPASYDWGDRAAAATVVRSRLASTLRSLNRSALARSTVVQVAYNRSLAADRAAANCPGGPDRQFGACEAIDGVVVQQRAGETHVLAAAFDVRVAGQRTEIRQRIVVGRR